METNQRTCLRSWHVHVIMWSLAAIAVALVGMIVFIMHDSVTPYSIPGSLTDAVEPRILSGDDAKVLMYCERHLAYHPDDIQARWYQAVAMHRLGQTATAEKEFEKIAGIDTNWSEYIKTYVERLGSEDRWTNTTQPTPGGDSERHAGAPSETPQE